jgi:Flp pilus assembly protein TadD
MPPDQLSTTPVAAAMLYRQGVVLLVAGRSADAIRLLQAAVTLDDQFAVALAALAVAEAELGDGERWRHSIDRAAAQRGVSRRERQHVAVIALALEGRLARASALGLEHLCEYPGDDVVAHVLATHGADLDDLQVT